jgi:hypothetical protein
VALAGVADRAETVGVQHERQDAGYQDRPVATVQPPAAYS